MKKSDSRYNHEADLSSLNSSLQRRLTLYSLAASAAGAELFAAAQPATAEVVYTSAHEVIQQNQQFAIDLNHDGVTDFTVQNIRKYSTSYKGARLQMVADAANAVGSSHNSFVKPLSKGAVIGPDSPFHGGAELMALQQKIGSGRTFGHYQKIDSEGTYSFGNWFQSSDRYVGFKIKIGGQTHYGWARLSTHSNSPFRIVAELSGYAYETEVGKPIIAGNTKSQATTPRNPTLGALALGALGPPSSAR
jgi:hypothetical protein